MAYNWNAELCQQRKYRLLLNMSLGLSIIAFVVVIAMLSYYLADLGVQDTPDYSPLSNWSLRS